MRWNREVGVACIAAALGLVGGFLSQSFARGEEEVLVGAGSLGANIIALNSMCVRVGGCGTDYPQIEWLKEDLEASDARCVLAYWHHPVFSSGYREDDPRTRPAWEVLYDHGAELVVNGHDHVYERFAPRPPRVRSTARAAYGSLLSGRGAGP